MNYIVKTTIMGIIIVGFLMFIIGILSGRDNIFSLLMIIFGFAIFILLSIIALVGVDVKTFENQYNNIKYETLVYRSSDVPENYNYLHTLDGKMKLINGRIEMNKKYADNFWVGAFYDKRIGEYEKFDIKKELQRE